MEKKSFAGLVDVVGGRMWKVSVPVVESEWFCTKAEAQRYIKEKFSGVEKETLLEQLTQEKNRAYFHA